jgi:Spy/CpxP family protein refolding chaperone
MSESPLSSLSLSSDFQKSPYSGNPSSLPGLQILDLSNLYEEQMEKIRKSMNILEKLKIISIHDATELNKFIKNLKWDELTNENLDEQTSYENMALRQYIVKKTHDIFNRFMEDNKNVFLQKKENWTGQRKCWKYLMDVRLKINQELFKLLYGHGIPHESGIKFHFQRYHMEMFQKGSIFDLSIFTKNMTSEEFAEDLKKEIDDHLEQINRYILRYRHIEDDVDDLYNFIVNTYESLEEEFSFLPNLNI